MPINSLSSENDQNLQNATQLINEGNNKTILNNLTKENQELKEKIQEYDYLKEQLMANRVEEKAKEQLISSLTLSGIILTILGIFGLKSLYDYSKNLVTKKVGSISEEQINTILIKEGKHQVAEIVKQKQPEWEALITSFAKQQINQITVATSPVGISEKQPAISEATLRHVDLTSFMTPVRDQGNEGSTTGFAVAAALEYQIYKKLKEWIIISPRYIYYYAKIEANVDPHIDSGAWIKNAVRILKTKGAVSEDVWPYKPGDLESDPPEQVKKAKKFKIAKSLKLTTIEDIKSALQNYGAVVTGISIFDSISKVNETGIVPDPAPRETIWGGHAICIVGYDDDKKLIKFKNSWNENWGDKGYGYFSYDYIQKFSSDTWVFWL